MIRSFIFNNVTQLAIFLILKLYFTIPYLNYFIIWYISHPSYWHGIAAVFCIIWPIYHVVYVCASSNSTIT